MLFFHFEKNNKGVRDFETGIRDAEYRQLTSGFWLLISGYWINDTLLMFGARQSEDCERY